ncbi:MAG TPA: phosphoribosylformylglycinamidine synthase subunit PurS [Paracoccus sp.]|nr:phosphoribosylformylglycinamidine synthase subunit PurS [Paracoccus sp. (in: a-proteobacteria)]
MKARVHVMLKTGVLDPQGEAVRQGKVIELDLAETDPARAEETLTQMCEKLLANTVIERYSIELV